MLYIMRHGKTDWNAMRKLQGRTDIPLNEEGRQMAEHARTEYADIHFDICYCSPYPSKGNSRDRIKRAEHSDHNGRPVKRNEFWQL